MLLHTTFKLNSVITVKIKCTLHCLYIELYEESAVFGVVVFKASMLDWGGVDLPGDLPISALIVNIQNCHSHQLAHLPMGVDLPGDLLNFWQDRVDPISALNIQFMDTKW